MITPEWLEFSKHGGVAHHWVLCLPLTWPNFYPVSFQMFLKGLHLSKRFLLSQMDSGDKSDKRGNGFIWHVRSEHDVNEICAAILCLAIRRCRHPSVSSRVPPTHAGKLVSVSSDGAAFSSALSESETAALSSVSG